ncbi:hypothetical protein COCNU_scaffold014693G000020 [Cocos nucifera]|nr:hypothetical protein [Cocos nucifera]
MMSQSDVVELFNPSVHLPQSMIQGIIVVADLGGLSTTNEKSLLQKRTMIRTWILDSLFFFPRDGGYVDLSTLLWGRSQHSDGRFSGGVTVGGCCMARIISMRPRTCQISRSNYSTSTVESAGAEVDEVTIGDLQNKVPSRADGGWLQQDPPTIKSALANRNGAKLDGDSCSYLVAGCSRLHQTRCREDGIVRLIVTAILSESGGLLEIWRSHLQHRLWQIDGDRSSSFNSHGSENVGIDWWTSAYINSKGVRTLEEEARKKFSSRMTGGVRLRLGRCGVRKELGRPKEMSGRSPTPEEVRSKEMSEREFGSRRRLAGRARKEFGSYESLTEARSLRSSTKARPLEVQRSSTAEQFG